MEILEHLPPAQRDSLWSYQGIEPVAVPLATLPPNARVQLAQILSQWRAAIDTPLQKRLFTEEPAALVERLALYRTGTWWALYLPESPSDQTPASFKGSFAWTLAPCSLPLKDDTPPEVIFHRR